LKRILIIYPHFPPSNLAGVHRPRLFANHLKSFGWEPVILTVHEKYYEEALDWNLHKLLPKDLRVEKVDAFIITKPRLIGDIGLRAFFQLRKRALQLLKTESFDFVYIPIPSFYVALLGPYLKKKTGVKYGIDYIDPWVHEFPGSDKLLSRHWFSTKLAKWLEPKAVRDADLITGVAEGYYQGVIDRNPKLKETCIFGAMPYGGEKSDHEKLVDLNIKPYLFQKNNKLKVVYAGAMLPKAYSILETFFQFIERNKSNFENIEFYFVGTGKISTDPYSFNIKNIAQKYNIWNNVIFEFPKRIPYLDVLTHLKYSSGVFILGSTETHYTPSKLYQAVLSEKSIFAILKQKSTAADIIKESNVGIVVNFNDEFELQSLNDAYIMGWGYYIQFLKSFNPEFILHDNFNKYSARNTTRALVDLLNSVTEKK
jgi:hypothetical protein